MAFYELRQYHVMPGKMDEWVAFMEGTIIPFQVSKGMVITGSYREEIIKKCSMHWMPTLSSVLLLMYLECLSIL